MNEVHCRSRVAILACMGVTGAEGAGLDDRKYQSIQKRNKHACPCGHALPTLKKILKQFCQEFFLANISTFSKIFQNNLKLNGVKIKTNMLNTPHDALTKLPS